MTYKHYMKEPEGDDDRKPIKYPQITLWIVVRVSLEESRTLLEKRSEWREWHKEEGYKKEIADMYSYIGKVPHSTQARLVMQSGEDKPVHDQKTEMCFPVASYDEKGKYEGVYCMHEVTEVGRIEAQIEVLRRIKQTEADPALKRRIWMQYPEIVEVEDTDPMPDPITQMTEYWDWIARQEEKKT